MVAAPDWWFFDGFEAFEFGGLAGPICSVIAEVKRQCRLFVSSKTSAQKTFRYLYDFGNGWERTIKVEHIFDAEPSVQYPSRRIDAVGRRPPKDCGGPWGYPEVHEIADPKHERHAELTEWIGGAFDPDARRL
jgi:hypothetical protein